MIFDDRGYVVSVSYLVLDAERIEARTRDGASIDARLVGVDLDTGLAVVRLVGAGPWPAARLGDSRDMIQGAVTGTVGVDEDTINPAKQRCWQFNENVYSGAAGR